MEGGKEIFQSPTFTLHGSLHEQKAFCMRADGASTSQMLCVSVGLLAHVFLARAHSSIYSSCRLLWVWANMISTQEVVCMCFIKACIELVGVSVTRKPFPFELLVSMHIWVEHNKNMTLLQALARMSSFSV